MANIRFRTTRCKSKIPNVFDRKKFFYQKATLMRLFYKNSLVLPPVKNGDCSSAG